METPRFICYADVVTGVLISSAALAAIRAHAASEPDREVCGLLLGERDHVTAIAPAANVAPDPVRRFEIDPAALFAAIRAQRAGGPGLIGYYHSHPGGSVDASPTDRANAAPDGKIWLIAADAQVRAYRAGDNGLIPIELSCKRH